MGAGAAALEILARQVQAALDLVGVCGGEQDVPNNRHGGAGDFSEDFRPGRHVAPGQHFEALVGERVFEVVVGLSAIGREKDDADGEGLRGQEREAAGGEQQLARDRRADADAVAREPVGGDGAAVGEAAEGNERLLEDGVRGDVREGGDETDAAALVLEAWVVEPGGVAAGGGAGSCRGA